MLSLWLNMWTSWLNKPLNRRIDLCEKRQIVTFGFCFLFIGKLFSMLPVNEWTRYRICRLTFIALSSHSVFSVLQFPILWLSIFFISRWTVGVFPSPGCCTVHFICGAHCLDFLFIFVRIESHYALWVWERLSASHSSLAAHTLSQYPPASLQPCWEWDALTFSRYGPTLRISWMSSSRRSIQSPPFARPCTVSEFFLVYPIPIVLGMYICWSNSMSCLGWQVRESVWRRKRESSNTQDREAGHMTVKW